MTASREVNPSFNARKIEFLGYIKITSKAKYIIIEIIDHLNALFSKGVIMIPNSN